MRIELEIDDVLIARARHLAAARHATLDRFVSDLLAQSADLSNEDVTGSFADEPELLDQIVEEAMQAREQHALRTPDKSANG